MASELSDFDDGQGSDLLLDGGHHDLMSELSCGDEPLFGNNQMMMLLSSMMGEVGQVASLPLNIDEFHAMATANLISQTQEAIIKEYNIDMESPDLFGTNFTNLEPVLPSDLESYANSPETFENIDNTPYVHGNSDIPIEVIEAPNTGYSQATLMLKETDGCFNPGNRVTDICIHNQSRNESVTCKVDKETSSMGHTDLPTESKAHALMYKPDNKCMETNGTDEFKPCGQIRNHTVKIETIVSTDMGVNNILGNHTVSESITGKDKAPKELRNGGLMKRQNKVQKHQDITEGDGIVCELCGKLFRNKKGLHNHMTTHNPLCCPIPGCERTFSYPSHYKYHLLTHSQERNFICDCRKTFYTSQQLEVHQRSHNLDKPFTCNQCQKSFTTAGNLKNHERLHTGERPYVCTVTGCGKSFAEDSSLKKHILTHSGAKPYKCSICQKGFTQSSSRSYHMKHKHPQTVILSSRTDTNIGVT